MPRFAIQRCQRFYAMLLDAVIFAMMLRHAAMRASALAAYGAFTVPLMPLITPPCHDAEVRHAAADAVFFFFITP